MVCQDPRVRSPMEEKGAAQMPRHPTPGPADQPLFEPPPVGRAPPNRRQGAPSQRLWTHNKALLIERYLYYFVMVTKGGNYIDGFAGPQYPDRPQSWAARLVAESQPPWLTSLLLFELDQRKLDELEALRAEHPKRIRVFAGDFNVRVDEILRPSVISPKRATFCLLDQQTFECRWSTLQRLAAYRKDGYKIELFYFLAEGWFARAVAGTKTQEGERKIEDWWGAPGWRGLRTLKGPDRASVFADRLCKELGYWSALPYAIYDPEHGERVMYWMIHATDHPAAPKLMDRAYEKAVLPKEPLDHLQLELGLDPTA